MAEIITLPEEIVAKIAAGEVIFRPQSVVKELIENAIDAGADRIEVEIAGGGRRLIRVFDNGRGMDREDLLRCYLKHTTSKIKSLSDLDRVVTLGFRGEALAAIAAVSRLRIASRTTDSELGHVIEVMEGELLSITEIGMEKGTEVSVYDLFFNLPARRKFLRSARWETKLVVEKLKQYAFAYPEIRFILRIDGRDVMDLSKKDLPERVADLSGFDDLIMVEGGRYPVRIKAYLPPPEKARAGENLIFVNKRPVVDRKINAVVREHYGDKPTFFLLFLDVAPEFYDVNVHPSKSEVRFHDHRYLTDLLNKVIATKIPKGKTVEQATLLLKEELRPDRLFQLHKSYILAETEGGLIIIDQHAAHERIIYERILNRGDEGQPLLFPISLELNDEQLRIFEEVKEILIRFGIKTRRFGPKSIVIETVPSLTTMDAEDVIAMFDDLAQVGVRREEIAKVIACHAAIKTNTPLTDEEMHLLIDQLFNCSDPYHCPHGRPTHIKISIEEMNRRLGR